MALEKAHITNLETNEEIPCLFNPTEYAIAKNNRWDSVKVMGDDVPMPKFISGGAMKLTMTLFFDTYENKKDVRTYTEKLFKLMQVDRKLRNKKNKKGRPPRCMFNWGKKWGFKAIITQMKQRFTLFLEDGTPVRATVDVTFQQVEKEGSYPPQNPTTQADLDRSIRIVKPGDRLDLIAYQEYGDPTLWKQIAEANEIANPMDIQPGQRLVIVPAE